MLERSAALLYYLLTFRRRFHVNHVMKVRTLVSGYLDVQLYLRGRGSHLRTSHVIILAAQAMAG